VGNLVTVGISDMKIVTGDDMLITYALGSCIGTCLYDSVTGVMGLSHILLPQSSLCPTDRNIQKFADTALKQLVLDMRAKGAAVGRITAKIAGGAQMFLNNSLKIGERNIEAVTNELKILGIKIIASDVGADYGRTMHCHATDGKVLIKSMSKGSRFI
jgi:chemotaxis protein CheD